ncbi:hypothetical protein PLICRDRAFT_482426 [Plicaturopsis crispa FD-325 SS-3]|nr:hypothetical protein PLICRDRAFT_482426 [Plicaturopsis crispa FD-325 SS-3]
MQNESEASVIGAACAPLSKRGIPQSTYDDLVRYTKYSSGAYLLACPRPIGNTLVERFSDLLTDTQGFIARDDERQEIIVAFRGSQEPGDAITDAAIALVPLVSPGVNAEGARVHSGFMNAYNSVAAIILATVKAQRAAYHNYTFVATGHSLGGALASLCGLSHKSNFPKATVKLYTFGQPRTGDPAYAALVDKVVGRSNSFRAVHTFDGVPTIIPTLYGYRHHGTEFWQYTEPPNAANTMQCSGGEDASCSASIPSTGINSAHNIYFGQAISLDPSVCM